MESTNETRTFATGAIRDGASRKPMLQLISPHALFRLGEWLRIACQDRKPEPYPPRNWEKGMPFSETIGSLERHLQKFKLGSKKEDHIAAILFGAMAIAHYEEEIAAGRLDPALDDMPKYEQQPGLDLRVDPAAPGGDRSVEHIFPPEVLASAVCRDLEQTVKQYVPFCTCLDCQAVRVARDGECVEVSDPRYATLASDVDRFIAVVLGGEKRVAYVTGPMRGIEYFNFPAFDKARDQLVELGFAVISPADIDRLDGLDPFEAEAYARCSANKWLSSGGGAGEAASRLDSIVRRDIGVVLGLNRERDDFLYALDGWKGSTGALAEIRVAEFRGLSVYPYREAIPFDRRTGKVFPPSAL